MLTLNTGALKGGMEIIQTPLMVRVESLLLLSATENMEILVVFFCKHD